MKIVTEYEGIGGFYEILDLAVEPIRRMDHPRIYPRLASQTVQTVRDLLLNLPRGNLKDLPLVILQRCTFGEIVSYCVSRAKVSCELKKVWHPLLTDTRARP